MRSHKLLQWKTGRVFVVMKLIKILKRLLAKVKREVPRDPERTFTLKKQWTWGKFQ